MLILAVACGGAAGATEPADKPLKPTITDAGPHHWVSEGDPYGDTLADLDIDPANPNVLYACGLGGLFRTTDGARTWQPVELLPGEPAAVEEAAVCGDTIYAKRPWRSTVLRSTDAGKSWKSILNRGPISDLLVDPDDPETLYAVNRGEGVLKSTDGGTTWDTLDAVLQADLAMCPDAPNVLWWRFPYAARFESPDGGETWEVTRSVSPDISVTRVEHDPDDPDAWRLTFDWEGDEWTVDHMSRLSRTDGSDPVGLSVTNSGQSRSGDKAVRLNLTIAKMQEKRRGLPSTVVHVTRDGGKTIRSIDLPVDGRWLEALRADPDDPDMLYVKKDSVYYFSSDGGETWELLYAPADDPDGTQTETIAFVRRLFYHGQLPEKGSRIVPDPSDPDVLYATGTRAAILKSTDGGRTWADAGRGVRTSCVRLFACHTTQPGAVYALTEKHFHRVRRWERSHTSHCSSTPSELVADADGAFALAPHPADGELVVLCAKGGAWLARDGGSYWRTIKHGLRGKPVACVFDPDDADRLCLLTTGGIAETTDRAATWNERKAASGEQCSGLQRVRQTNAKIIYSAPEKGQLLRSVDLGATWESTELLSTDVRDSHNAVYVHPADPSHLLVLGPKDTLSLSTDAGRTWQQIALWPETRCAAFDPKNPNVFYVGGDTVYRTRDGGKTFQKLDNDLPATPIAQIAISPTDGAVYAVTDGRGVYRLEIKTPSPNGKAAQ